MKRGRNSSKTVLLYHTGLTYFEKYLQQRYSLNIDAAVTKLHKNELDVYNIIEDFVTFLIQDLEKSPNTANETLKAVKSFLRSERISLDTKLANECASIPRAYKDSEFALDKVTVSKILQSVKVRRLRVFLFCLASSGCRVGELSSIRWKDIDFDSRPTTIHLRPEYTKTKTGRVVYISDEAKEELIQWRLFKERCRSNKRKSYDNIIAEQTKQIEEEAEDEGEGEEQYEAEETVLETTKEAEAVLVLVSKPIIDSNELVFQTRSGCCNSSESIVHKMQRYFASHLENLGLRVAKESGVTNNGHNNNNTKSKNNYIRHTITLHSFRRFFKSAVSFDAKEPDLSEFLIGHKSLSQTYFRVSPANVAKTYLNSVMEHLTFCDMASVEKAKEELNQKLIEERDAKDRELRDLKKRLSAYENKLDSVVNRIGDILGQADPLKQKEYVEAVESIQNQ